MYFPYLRCSQYGFQALTESATIVSSAPIVPIVEFASVAGPAITRWNALASTGMKLICVTNPQKGEVATSPKLSGMLTAGLTNPNAVMGFILASGTPLVALEAFLRTYNGRDLAIIHRGQRSDVSAIATLLASHPEVKYQVFISETMTASYPALFSGGMKVMMEDGFNRARVVRNADYDPEDFYSDLRWQYATRSFDGFGDFLVVEDNMGGGGRINAVAIHLTYVPGASPQQVYVKHFISDRRTGTKDAPGKTLEAVRHLLAEVDANPAILRTEAIEVFREILRTLSSEHPGRIKAISHRHHIELMANSFRP